MKEPVDHSRLVERFSLQAELVCQTAVHVGAGKASTDVRAASDLPVVRDGAGDPYIPGSSFRGALRSGLESLLRGIGDSDKVCDPFSDDSCAERIKVAKKDLNPQDITESRVFHLAWDKSCPICSLFGSTFLASRLWIADLTMKKSRATYLRNGVGLDRDLRTAAKGVLYDFEAVAAGSRFTLRIDLENPADYEVGLLLTGLDLFGQGILNVGGKRARGLGTASVEDPSVRRWTAADFFDPEKRQGTKLGDPELDAFRAAARQHYVGG